MSKLNLRNLTIAAVLTLFGGVLALSANTVSAQQPTQTTPAFNIFDDTQNQGDEADFVRVRNPNTNQPFTNNVDNACTDGQEVSIQVYIHNGATQGLNGDNFDGPAVATGTTLSLTRSAENVNGRISAQNAPSIADMASVTCNGEEVDFDFLPGSGLQTNSQGNVPLSDDLFTAGGTLVGFESPNGIMPGCWEFVTIVYARVVVNIEPEVEEPVYACEVVQLAFDDRKARFVIRPVVDNGASFKKATFTYVADGSEVNTDMVTTLDADGNAASEYMFAEGSEKISANAKMQFNLPDGSMPEVACGEGNNVLGVVTPPQPPVELPKTGAGENIAGFLAAVAGAGAIAHRKFALKRQ